MLYSLLNPNLGYHSIQRINWGSFRGRGEEKWGPFRGRFGDHLFKGWGSFRRLYIDLSIERENLNPWLQEQLNESNVFTQEARLERQTWSPSSDSPISLLKKRFSTV